VAATLRPPVGPRSKGFNRRRFIQAGAIGAAGAAGLPLAASAGDDGEQDGPMNLVLVVIDTLRADHLACYGSPRARTPAFNGLAGRGITFSRAFPEAMATVPARRSIFSGTRTFPFRDWVVHPGLGGSPGWAPLPDVSRAFTTVLRRSGYYTAQVSDNPHTTNGIYWEPFRDSFDRFITVPGRGGAVIPPETVPEQVARQWLPPSMRDAHHVAVMRRFLANHGRGKDERRTGAARVFSTAAEQLPRLARMEKPFALVVDCFDPHEPWVPTRKYIDMYADPDYTGPEVGTLRYRHASSYLRPRDLRRMRTLYAATVSMVDHWLGRFLERLAELELAGNTAVAVISDHGLLLGERGWTGKVPSQLHPELAHVPLIVAHPAGKEAGAVVPRFATTSDVGPTLLGMAGVSVPDWMTGSDLSPLFDGEQPADDRSFHYGGYFNRFWIRTDRWALFGENRGIEFELYDLTLDRYERRNIARERPDVAEGLYASLLEATDGPLPWFDAPPELRQLGYDTPPFRIDPVPGRPARRAPLTA